MIALLPHIIMSVVSSVAEDCNLRAACRYDGLEGFSSTLHEYQIQAGDHWTCQAMCDVDATCDAVTSDETGSQCRFHHDVGEEACIEINSVQGMTLWVKSRGGQLCHSVRLLRELYDMGYLPNYETTYDRTLCSRHAKKCSIANTSFQLK